MKASAFHLNFLLLGVLFQATVLPLTSHSSEATAKYSPVYDSKCVLWMPSLGPWHSVEALSPKGLAERVASTVMGIKPLQGLIITYLFTSLS